MRTHKNTLKHSSKVIPNAVIYGACFIFTVLYASLLFSHNIWTDEAFTIQLLKKNLSGIIAGTAADVHPPLYYIYLKVWCKIFGKSLISMKMASLLPMSAVLFWGAAAIQKRFGNDAALFYVLFLACIPCTMEFSVQIRMYSLALMAVTLCGIYAYDAFMGGRWQSFLLTGICGVVAAYTHYFAFVPIIMIEGFLFIAILIKSRKSLFMWCIMAVGMVLSYLPWFPYFIDQVTRVNSGYWIPAVDANSVWGYFIWTFELETISGTVFLFLILLKFLSIHNTIAISQKAAPPEIYALLCMLVPTATMLAGVIISVNSTPIYRDQYILPSLGLLAVFVGIAACHLSKKIKLVIGLFLIITGVFQYRESFIQEYKSTLLPETEALLDANFGPSDSIVYNWKTFDFIYDVQFPEYPQAYITDFDWGGDFGTVWFFYTADQPQMDPGILEAYGLVMEPVGHYGIEHNEFDIYKIYHQ